MKLSTQIGASMSILAVLVIIMGSFLLYQMQKLNGATDVISTSRLPIVMDMGTVNTAVADYRRLQFVHILSANPEQVKRVEKLLAKERAKLEQAIENVKSRLQTPTGKTLFAEVINNSKIFFEGSQRLRTVANEGRKDEARALLFGETKKYFENLRESIEKNIASVQAVSHDLADEADALFIFSRLSGMILILVALLASAGLTFLIVRHVGNLLGKDPSELQKIAQRGVNGDYAIDDGKAKAGVYGSIVSMVDALKSNIDAARRESENARQQTAKAEEAVARAEEAQKQAQSKSAAMISIADRLASMSEVMASASSQLAERISQADQASQESSARLSDAAAAIGQMNASVSEVASNASSAAQASTSTKEKAEAGAHIVEKVVHSIEEIYQVSTALKQDMEQLNAHAQAINDIMVVISDIADQTNLLALNAAIEAARAGEAGRGFAVVADEVRKLAEKTMSSTQDVATAIRAIQGSTEQSVRAMEAVAQKVGEANQFAGDSGKALQAIVATVENAAMQVHAIATASEEQSAASEEINRGIMQVDSMAKQNLDAMNQAAQAVQQLVSQAGTLNTLVHELREA